MKVNKNGLRRMILKEMGHVSHLPTGGSQRGSLSRTRRGRWGRSPEDVDPAIDYGRRLAEVDDDDTLAGDLEAAEDDMAAAEVDLSSIEDNAMAAIKAIYDLATAAGVELEVDADGPSDVEVDVDVEDVEEVLQEMSRSRVRRILLSKLTR